MKLKFMVNGQIFIPFQHNNKIRLYISTVVPVVGNNHHVSVTAKVPKPTLTFDCKDGVATLTCDTGDRTDLTVSWYKEDKIIQNEKKPQLLLTSAQVQEDKPYSCSVSNPVSSEQSDSVTVSCKSFFFLNASHSSMNSFQFLGFFKSA